MDMPNELGYGKGSILPKTKTKNKARIPTQYLLDSNLEKTVGRRSMPAVAL